MKIRIHSRLSIELETFKKKKKRWLISTGEKCLNNYNISIAINKALKSAKFNGRILV